MPYHIPEVAYGEEEGPIGLNSTVKKQPGREIRNPLKES